MPSIFAPKKWAFVAALPVAALLATAGTAMADNRPLITHDPVANPKPGGYSITASQMNGRIDLTFPSQVRVAQNALVVSGSRRDTTVDTMDAYQTVGGQQSLVGALQFNDSYGHHHWHYIALDRYELRTHNGLIPVARDQKSGFCLVQEWNIGGVGHTGNPSDCQKTDPNRLSTTGTNALGVVETIDPAQPNPVDLYSPAVDGQYIDITGIAAGDYELIQWVNADCRLIDQGPGDYAHGHSTAVVLHLSYSPGNPVPNVAVDTNTTPNWANYYNSLPLAQRCLTPETTRPAVSGNAQVNSIVSATPGSWLTRMATGVSVPNPFTYQWRRCDSAGWACSDIPGATSANYVPTDAELGHTLRARVTAVWAGTMEQDTPEDSSPTGVIADASTLPPGGGGGGGGGGNTGPNTGPNIISLTAAIKSSKAVSVRRLVKSGLNARAHCSEACKVTFSLVGRGGVKLGKLSGKLTKAGSKTFTMRLSHKAKRVVSRFHGGTLTLWLYVKSSDGQQQTVSRVLNLRV
jgi:hypothetical protein